MAPKRSSSALQPSTTKKKQKKQELIGPFPAGGSTPTHVLVKVKVWNHGTQKPHETKTRVVKLPITKVEKFNKLNPDSEHRCYDFSESRPSLTNKHLHLLTKVQFSRAGLDEKRRVVEALPSFIRDNRDELAGIVSHAQFLGIHEAGLTAVMKSVALAIRKTSRELTLAGRMYLMQLGLLESPWVINEVLHANTVITPECSGEDGDDSNKKQFIYTTVNAVTEAGTRHPFVWQVLQVRSKNDRPLIGCVYKDNKQDQLHFVPAGSVAECLGEKLASTDVFGTVDVAVLEQDYAMVAACLKLFADKGNPSLGHDCLKAVFNPKAVAAFAGRYTPTTKMRHGTAEAQAYFWKAFGTAPEDMEGPSSVIIGSLPWEVDLDLTKHSKQIRDVKISRSTLKSRSLDESKCWLCNHALGNNKVLGPTCKRALLTVVEKVEASEPWKAEMKDLMMNDPAQFQAELLNMVDAESVRYLAMVHDEHEDDDHDMPSLDDLNFINDDEEEAGEEDDEDDDSEGGEDEEVLVDSDVSSDEEDEDSELDDMYDDDSDSSSSEEEDDEDFE